MKLFSTLPRYIKFGSIEIAPELNEFDENQTAELKANKSFNGYVSRKEFTIEVDEVEGFDKISFMNLTDEEIKKTYSVKELKAMCKELKLTSYGKLDEDELISLITDALLED